MWQAPRAIWQAERQSAVLISDLLRAVQEPLPVSGLRNMSDEEQEVQAQTLEAKIDGMVERAMAKHLQPVLEQVIRSVKPGEKATSGGKQSTGVRSPAKG